MLNVLAKIFKSDVAANKVCEIKNELISSLQVLQRDDAMVLLAPSNNPNPGDKKNYEIVLQRTYLDSNTNSISLYRCENQEEAMEKFNAFVHRIPIFITIAKDFNNVHNLQRLSDALIENPSWSLAHLVAHFNLIEHINHPKIQEFIEYPDHVKYMSPFQLAIQSGHIEMVKALLPLCNIDHLDNNSNSVFHYAASTTKDIINILTKASTKHLNHINMDGFTPLHVACRRDKPECVIELIVAGADVNRSAQNINKSHTTVTPTSVADYMKTNAKKLYDQDMKNGGTPLHWCLSRETSQALIERGCDIDALNFHGQTALHVMVDHNRFESVVTLLSHDADIDIIDKDGNTAMHIAIGKKLVPIVQCLVVFAADINKKNKEGKSPRHMVGKETNGEESEILYILHSVGAKRCPESSNDCPPGCHHSGNYNGIPPVAPESMEQREHIQEMLATTSRSTPSNLNSTSNNKNITEFAPVTNLVDTSIEQKGQSVMDQILGMFSTKVVRAESPTSIPPKAMDIESVGDSTPVKSDISSSPRDSSDIQENNKRFGSRLLCLDGGGIRGLVLVQMLLEIEKLSQTPISQMFDWIAGTSTGGILALGLGCGKTMRQCMGIYLRMKEHCFVGSRPYASELLENVLKENLGEFTVMSDMKHPKIMVCGVMADRKPVDLHIFRNYKSASDLLGIVTSSNNRRVPPKNPEEQLVWRAARATGAAPSYFRAFGRFLDGGLIANNPTLDAMTEIHEYNMALRNIGRESEVKPISVVVSLGTGLIPVTELKEIDVFRPESIWDTAKLAYGISAIGNLLVDQATASDGRVVDRARAWCSMIGIPYFRFNPQLSEDIAMDEKNDVKIINMLWQTKAYIHANRNKVMELISLLK